MNAKATIQKYISPIPKKALAWVALALSLVIIGIGVVQTCKIKFCDTPLDLQTAKAGQLVYADIVGISRYIDQGCCFALDTNGSIFLISFFSDDLAEYEAQSKYWKGEGEAEPLRMVFSVSTLPFAHRHTMAAYWDMELETYEQQFTPLVFRNANNLYRLWYVFGIVFGIGSLLMIGVFDWYQDGTKSAFARQEQLGLLEEAARQLQDPSCHRYTKKEAVFTDDFLFSKYSSVVIPYSDLLWIYNSETSRISIFSRYGSRRANGLFAGTAELEPRDIFATGFDEESQQELDEIIAFIVSKNPDILVGSELDKKLQYRALVEAHSK